MCYQIDDLNFDREYNGLLEALRFFKLQEGLIITLDQKDVFEQDGFIIKMIPAYEYLAAGE